MRGFEAINCKAHGTVKEKKLFDTKCALWGKKKDLTKFQFLSVDHYTVSMCTNKQLKRTAGRMG